MIYFAFLFFGFICGICFHAWTVKRFIEIKVTDEIIRQLGEMQEKYVKTHGVYKNAKIDER